MTTFFCPKCRAAIKPENINGLFYTCDSCGYCDDSTFNMIMSVATPINSKELDSSVQKDGESK